MMNPYRSSRRTGVTLTELLVVLVIISLLSSIAVPVYINKAENARKAAAAAECRQIAEAEDACASIHGFYVPLQVLDDTAMGSSQDSNTDTIDREPILYLVDPSKPSQLLNVEQPLLSQSSLDPRVRNMVRKWEGPFLNTQRVFIRNAAANDPRATLDAQIRDFPLDPWGQPYRFYSPRGIIGANATSTNPSDWDSVPFSDGAVNTGEDRFDRYAIVSFGPDGTADNSASNNGNYDDIIYYFGTVGRLNNGTNGETTFNN